MRLAAALEEKKLDLRLRDKLLGDGKLTKQECDTYLQSLADDQAKSTYTNKQDQRNEASSWE